MEKINIAEILKDCPSGMELDCAMYDNCTFDGLEDHGYIEILVKTPSGQIRLTKYGCYIWGDVNAKCVIFPKGKTTWEGFIPPCRFKDGDIVATADGVWIGITAGGKSGEFMPTYCVITGCGEFEVYLNNKETWQFHRLATEEEKQKLFNAIKDNGYKWNADTKTLEKLPKFKDGDKIRHKSIKLDCILREYSEDILAYRTNIGLSLTHKDLEDWELVQNKFDITTLKPFESRVLVRHNKDNKWCGSFFSHIDGNLHSHCYKYVTIAGKSYPMCIPYEKNEHLLGTTNDCDEYFKTWE